MATRRPTAVTPGVGLGYVTASAGPVGQLTEVPPSGAQPGAFQVPLAPRAATMTASTSSTRFIEIDYNGNIIVSAVTSMNFTGPGVIVSNVGSAVTINIPGSNGTPTGPNNSLQYNSTGTLGGVANLTFNPSASILSVIGNVHAGYFVGDATRLFNVPGANIIGEIPYAAASNTANTALTAVTAGTVTTAAQPAITSVGTLTSVAATGNITTTGLISAAGNISATGNIRGGNIGTPGLIFATGNIYAQGNLGTAGLLFVTGNIGTSNSINGVNISASGNISGAYLVGDGSQITNLPAGNYNNANVTTLLASFGSNVISATGNITTSANVAGGNLKTTGLISATGDITGGNVNAGASIVATSHTGATFSATGTITGGNINTGGIVTATGNVTGGNLRTVGQVSATGNITGNYFVGNGSQLTGIAASYGNANVAANLAAFGSNPISTTGNITAGNIIGNVVASGAGTPTITSTGNLDLSAVTAVRVVGGGSFRLPTLTTAQIANLTAINGDMVYNSTTAKIQAYAGNVWGNITLS